jgi:hypothetical protein
LLWYYCVQFVCLTQDLDLQRHLSWYYYDK